MAINTVFLLPMLVVTGLLIAAVVLGIAKLFSHEKARTGLKVLLILPVLAVLWYVSLGHVRAPEAPPRPPRLTPFHEHPTPPAAEARKALLDAYAAVDGHFASLASAPEESAEDHQEAAAGKQDGEAPETGDAPANETASEQTDSAKESGTDEQDQPETPEPDRQTPELNEPLAEIASEGNGAAQQPAQAEDRPDWAGKPPRKVGGNYQISVTVGPYETRLECDRDLPAELRRVLDQYVGLYIGSKARGRVHLPLAYIRDHVVQADWQEHKPVKITPTGRVPEKSVPMVLLHVLLEFDHEANARIEAEWDKVVVARRLVGVGALTAAVLLLLSVAYGYLKVDLATGGARRGRLRLATAALILVLIVAGLMAVRVVSFAGILS